MTNDNGIFIQNVYYMLAYAFEALQQASFEHIAQEPFAHVHDLLGAILAKGMALQIKQGMYKQYVPAKADLPVLRGRVDVQQTFANQARRQKKLACLYEELSADNLPNRVLKSTAWLLLCLAPLKEQTQASLKRALLYYEPVSLVEPAAIAWKSLRLERKNQSMQMLLNICYFVLNHLLLTTESGRYQMAAFLDEHGMARLFEKFVLEYLKKHYPQFHASSPQVAWNEDSGQKEFCP